ncbi:F-box/kelch-repeat protein At3g24760 [Elaeis guineensis]|uniref:F-box/kelch-repeat protein At3g24760 n=1 Tax=Elaeis guineensis var. tenera TaxID=51953 RepID=A0A6I9S2J9_ELAGV|nr:F-box/kelch-repeat protein At3g24760 [Elaeis guineensis]
MTTENRTAGWASLSWDLTELILSYLPLRSIVRAGAVCRQWREVVTDPAFAARAAATCRRRPWFFLYGQNNVVLRKNQAFGFDPDAGEWVALPPSPHPSAVAHVDCFSGAGGFFFATTSSTRFCYAALLRGPWRETSPLHFSRCNPLVGVFAAGGRPRVIVAGGARFVGGLVDIEDRLAVEIYDTASDSWELCPPLPPDFRSGNSSQWLSGALLGGRLFFVFGIYSCSVAAFDVGRRTWTGVQTLRPPGVLFSFLLACGDRLVLAGLCNSPDGPTCFTLWAVDPGTMDFAEIAVMPHDLLASLFDTDDDDTKFASLKCVGLDGLVYVFNEDHHKAYPACVCEITTTATTSSSSATLTENLTCRWRKVPPLPGTVNRFHKVIAFCSPVLLRSVLAADGEVH